MDYLSWIPFGVKMNVVLSGKLFYPPPVRRVVEPETTVPYGPLYSLVTLDPCRTPPRPVPERRAPVKGTPTPEVRETSHSVPRSCVFVPESMLVTTTGTSRRALRPRPGVRCYLLCQVLQSGDGPGYRCSGRLGG